MMGYNEHLSNKETYEEMPSHVAEWELSNHRYLIIKFMNKHRGVLPENEWIYLSRASKIHNPRTPQIYFAIKMHKGPNKITTRPVASF